jgi:hypothetical protein
MQRERQRERESQSTPCLESCFNSILIESFTWNGRSREMYSQHYNHLSLFGNAEEMKTTASCLIIQFAEPFVWWARYSLVRHKPDARPEVTCHNVRDFAEVSKRCSWEGRTCTPYSRGRQFWSRPTQCYSELFYLFYSVSFSKSNLTMMFPSLMPLLQGGSNMTGTDCV